MTILIQNGRVIDPVNNINSILDVFIENGVISQIEKQITKNADILINASNQIVSPGFIDIHVHFRSPGQEHKEDFITGSNAAVSGGFTTVCPMANTNPVIDNPEMIKSAIINAEKNSVTKVLPVSAITPGMKGEKLVDVENILKAGCIAFSEDGKSVSDEKLKREILKLSAKLNFPVICHCESPDHTGGIINEGAVSEKLGLKGISSRTEEEIVERDIRLAKETGGHAHITHISTANSIELVRKGKSDGTHVTCDVTPHHFSLDDTCLLSKNTNFKMNPPLRDKKDIEAIITGIKDGTIDCIATDHAPHSAEEKNQSLEKAPFGIIGLETALSVAITFLVKPGHINFKRLIELLSVNPAKILKINCGNLKIGSIADITIFNPDDKRLITENNIKSKSKNTPYLNSKLTGFVTHTIVSGKLVFRNSEVLR